MGRAPVRGGGRRTPDGYLFELTGGHLALDLANTVDERATSSPRELLAEWADLVDWSDQAHALDASTIARLRRDGARRPEETRAVLRRVRFVREALHGVFAATATQRPPADEDLAVLNDALPLALERLRLAPAGEVFAWSWVHSDDALDVMLPPVLLAAAELLRDPDRLSRVRLCEADDVCRWLFLDLSRNRSRRWCDMAVCGNRAKARRHQARRAGVTRRRRPPAG